MLLVTDNPHTARFVREALLPAAITVAEVGDVEAALRVAAESAPDAVLQDLGQGLLGVVDLPTRMGVAVGAARVPVLALSGFVTKEEESRIMSAGYDDHIVRPVDAARLSGIVETHLAHRTASTSEHFGAGRTVILADDDPLQRKLGAFHLDRLGFVVVTASDGAEALELMRKRSPVSIVSDVMMPGIDGFKLCMEVRKDPALRELPIVLTSSSYLDEEDRALALRAGATAYVPRTPDFGEVMRTLRRVLESPRAPSPEAQAPRDAADVEREHGRRVQLQLERQVRLNAGVAQRCAILSAELSILSGISSALTSHEGLFGVLDAVLGASLDAGGIACGALYLSDAAGALRVSSFGSMQLGTQQSLETFFGDSEGLSKALASRAVLSLPAEGSALPNASRALRHAGVRSALLVPLVHRHRLLGGVLLASQSTRLHESDRRAFATGIANQLAQAVTLASAFSEREASERVAQESAATMSTMMGSMAEGVLVSDENEQVVYANLAAERILRAGAMQGDLRAITENFGYFLPDRTTPVAADQLPLFRAIRGEAVDGATLFMRSKASPQGVWLSVSARPLVAVDGKRRGAVAVFRDVTAERAAQEQLMVSDRMVSVGMLAAGVAHEINNPLAAALANLEFAARGLDALEAEGFSSQHMEPLRESLRDAREAADRVRQIVRDLKIFSRAEEEKHAPTDLRKVLDSSLRMAANEIRHRARVRRNYGELPLVDANESRLGQVFLNLIVNAAQAISEGRADENELCLTTRTDDSGRAVVEVRDTGTGIPPDVLSRLFTPFVTTKPTGVGTGLGLAICQRIVTSLGGEISVDSEMGKGSTFRVALPAAEVEQVYTAPVRASARASRRGKVLVVDDDALIGKAVLRALSDEHEVTVVPSASEALAGIGRGDRYDVILCDLMMPVVTGMEFHQELSERVPGQARRVVFLTGGAFTARAREYLDRVPNPRLEKPFEVQNLRAIVNGRVR